MKLKIVRLKRYKHFKNKRMWNEKNNQRNYYYQA